MKNKAIYQVCIGHNPMYELSIKTVAEYCRKYGIDHIVSRTVKVGGLIYYEKFFLWELAKSYSQVAYLDCDVLVTPHAKNIFEEYSNNEVFYAFEENGGKDPMDRNYIVSALETEENQNWPLNDLGHYRYFNAGIFIASYIADPRVKAVPSNNAIHEFGDQTIMNYGVVKNKLKYESLDHSFNRMHLGVPDPNNERLKANFIHYAGPNVYGNREDKFLTFQRDFNTLYS